MCGHCFFVVVVITFVRISYVVSSSSSVWSQVYHDSRMSCETDAQPSISGQNSPALWSYSLPVTYLECLVDDKNNIYVLSGFDIECVDGNTGSRKYKTLVQWEPGLEAFFDTKRRRICACGESLTCVHLEDGSVAWQYNSAGGRCFLDLNGNFLISGGESSLSSMICVNPDNGQVLWNSTNSNLGSPGATVVMTEKTMPNMTVVNTVSDGHGGYHLWVAVVNTLNGQVYVSNTDSSDGGMTHPVMDFEGNTYINTDTVLEKWTPEAQMISLGAGGETVTAMALSSAYGFLILVSCTEAQYGLVEAISTASGNIMWEASLGDICGYGVEFGTIVALSRNGKEAHVVGQNGVKVFDVGNGDLTLTYQVCFVENNLNLQVASSVVLWGEQSHIVCSRQNQRQIMSYGVPVNASPSSPGLALWIIIVIVVGGIAILSGIAAVAVCLIRRTRRTAEKSPLLVNH